MSRRIRFLLPWLAATAAISGCRVEREASAADASTVADTLTVVTLNIWHDQQDWPARFEYMTRELRGLAPDVLALQEVLQHDDLPNQAESFAAALGYDVHFSSVDPEDRPRRYGNAILTPHPITARNWKALEPLNDYRTVAHARITVAGTELDVYNTHLHHTAEGGMIRREQLEDLLAFIEETRGGGPLILLGDFNAPPDAPELRLLAGAFVDAWAAVQTDTMALGRTTLNTALGHTPRRIDHIFVERGRLQPVATRIILDEPDAAGRWASDHFGLAAWLRR
jgi:endonuclease/exonuclease/phosphatase family metal-dependent hydrolase